MEVAFIFGQTLFAKVYGLDECERGAYSVIQTSDGGYAAVGFWESSLDKFYNALVFKISPDGTFEWAKAIEGDPAISAYSIIQTSDGGYVVAAHSQAALLLSKLSPYGTLEGVRTVRYVRAYSLIRTSDGGYALAGDRYLENFAVLKFSPDGSVEWARVIDAWGEARSVIQTSDGGYAVAGHVWYSVDGRYLDLNIVVLKLSSDGRVEWVRSYGTPEDDEAYSIIQASDGGYVIAGVVRGYGARGTNVLLLKLNPDGSVDWARSFGGDKDDGAHFLIQAQDGGYVVAGYYGGEDYDTDLFLLKTFPDGFLRWVRVLHARFPESAESVLQTPEGAYVVGGETESFGEGCYNFLVLKVGPGGYYPGCLQSYPIEVGYPQFTVSPLGFSISSPEIDSRDTTLVLSPVSLRVADVCSGARVPPIFAFPAPHGIVFRSQREFEVDIFSANGRLVKRVAVPKGETFVPIRKTGIYIWMAGGEKGKSFVVR